jgi:hypothetical protein
MIEGQAELASTLVRARERGHDISSLRARDIDGALSRVISGETSLEYTYGLRYLLPIYQEGGWEAVDAVFDDLPVSTEEVLHPEKVGTKMPPENDLSGTLALAEELGLTLLTDDTLGELALRAMLGVSGLSNDHSFLVAAGWDGDRLLTFRDSDGRCAVTWRMRWDREEDSVQLIEALELLPERSSRLSAQVHGREVNIVMANEKLAPRLIDELRRTASKPAVDLAEAESTQAMEFEYATRALAAVRVEKGRWIVTAAGVSVPMPKGWEALDLKGLKFIRGPLQDGFGDNLLVVVEPNIAGHDLAGLAAHLEREYERVPTMQLVSIETRELGGLPAVWSETTTAADPTNPAVHSISVAVLRGETVVSVVVTTTQERWPSKGPGLRELLEATTWLEMP